MLDVNSYRWLCKCKLGKISSLTNTGDKMMNLNITDNLLNEGANHQEEQNQYHNIVDEPIPYGVFESILRVISNKLELCHMVNYK